MSGEARSPLLQPASSQGRQSVSPSIGSGRVKSPLPAPVAYRASCMSAAAKRYKVYFEDTNEKRIAASFMRSHVLDSFWIE